MSTHGYLDPRTGRLVTWHESRIVTPNTIRVWDGRFLLATSDPNTLRTRTGRITGACVNEVGAVEALPVSEWEKLSR